MLQLVAPPGAEQHVTTADALALINAGDAVDDAMLDRCTHHAKSCEHCKKLLEVALEMILARIEVAS